MPREASAIEVVFVVVMLTVGAVVALVGFHILFTGEPPAWFARLIDRTSRR